MADLSTLKLRAAETGDPVRPGCIQCVATYFLHLPRQIDEMQKAVQSGIYDGIVRLGWNIMASLDTKLSPL